MRQYVPSIDAVLKEFERLTTVAVTNISDATRSRLLKAFGNEFEEIRGYNCWVYRLMDKPRQGNLFYDSDPMVELLNWLSDERVRFMTNPPKEPKVYNAMVIAGNAKAPCMPAIDKDLNDTPQLDGMSHTKVGCESAQMKSAKRLFRVTVSIQQVGYRMDEAGLESFTKNVIELYLNRAKASIKSAHRFAHFEIKKVSV